MSYCKLYKILCANAVSARLNGIDANAVATKPNGYGSYSDLRPTIPFGTKANGPHSVEYVTNYFSKLENGANGAVVIPQGNISHVINVVKKDNQIYFIDGQRGQIVKLDSNLNVEFGVR